MDLPAIAETTVEMLVLIETKLIGRKRENIDPEVKAVMLDKAMSLYMTHIINEKKYPSGTPGATGQIEPPSVAQIKYAEDLGITNARSMSKQECTKAIDEALHG